MTTPLHLPTFDYAILINLPLFTKASSLHSLVSASVDEFVNEIRQAIMTIDPEATVLDFADLASSFHGITATDYAPLQIINETIATMDPLTSSPSSSSSSSSSPASSSSSSSLIDTTNRILVLRLSDSMLETTAEQLELMIVSKDTEPYHGVSFPFRCEYRHIFPTTWNGQIFSAAERILITQYFLQNVTFHSSSPQVRSSSSSSSPATLSAMKPVTLGDIFAQYTTVLTNFPFHTPEDKQHLIHILTHPSQERILEEGDDSIDLSTDATQATLRHTPRKVRSIGKIKEKMTALLTNHDSLSSSSSTVSRIPSPDGSLFTNPFQYLAYSWRISPFRALLVRLLILDTPLHSIREYLGEAIALYFAFASYYTQLLLLPGIAGVLLVGYNYWYGTTSSIWMILYSSLICIWASIFLKLWKRRESELAFNWATTGLGNDTNKQQLRKEHTGPVVFNPISREYEQRESVRNHALRYLFVTVPTLAGCLGIIITVIMYLEPLRIMIETDTAPYLQYLGNVAAGTTATLDDPCTTLLPEYYQWLPCFLIKHLRLIPTILYAIIIPLVDSINRTIVIYLTFFENHRTHAEHNNSLISKLALLKFMNNFTALFYIGFYQQDLVLLGERLFFNAVIGQFIINPLLEQGLPTLLNYWYRFRQQQKYRIQGMLKTPTDKKAEDTEQISSTPVPSFTERDSTDDDPSSSSSVLRNRRRRGSASTTVPTTTTTTTTPPSFQRTTMTVPEFPSSSSSSSYPSTLASLSPSSAALINQYVVQFQRIRNAVYIQQALGTYDEFDDMLEFFLQYAIVTLFAAVFPLAAPLALLNNIWEASGDALKIMQLRRPVPKRARDLGPWSRAFQLLGYVSVISNSIIISIAGRKAGLFTEYENKYGIEIIIIIAIIIEHILVLLKLMIEDQIPDQKVEVRDNLIAEAIRRPILIRYALSGEDSSTLRGSRVLSQAFSSSVPSRLMTDGTNSNLMNRNGSSTVRRSSPPPLSLHSLPFVTVPSRTPWLPSSKLQSPLSTTSSNLSNRFRPQRLPNQSLAEVNVAAYNDPRLSSSLGV